MRPADTPAGVLLLGGCQPDRGPSLATLVAEAGVVDVTLVDTLADALELLAGQRFGCIVVDLQCACNDGLAAVSALRQAAGDTAVVAVADDAEVDSGVEAIRSGADDFLPRSDATPAQLRRVLAYGVERTRLRRRVNTLSSRAAAVMDALTDGLMVIDGDGIVTSVNPAAVDLLGPEAREIVGKPIAHGPWELTHRDGTPLEHEDWTCVRAQQTGQTATEQDLALQTPDGGITWLDVNAYVLRDGLSTVDSVVVSLRDVNERHAAEAAHRFRATLLAAVGQAVIVTDAEGTVLLWNPAAERLYGWSAAEAVGRPILELTPSRQSAEQAAELLTALSAGESWTGDFEVRRRDGTLFPALVTDAPVFDEAGNLVAIIGVSMDISERKRAEENARTLSAIVTSSADAIFTEDLDGTIRSWNSGAEQLYGYSAAEAIGQDVMMLDPRRDEELQAIFATARTGATVSGFEAIRRRRDGSDVAVSLTVSPMYDDAGDVVGVSVIGRDISDRRKLEAELRNQALYDSLTGLPNRTLLDDRIKQALRRAARRGSPVAVVFCDLDHVKRVNDSSGHLVGDELLKEAANRLATAVRPSDTVARFGGDEFVVVCDDTDTASAQDLAGRLSDALRAPMAIDGRRYHVTASMGIAVAPPLPAEAATLLSRADAAMYDAKAAGRACARVFDASMVSHLTERLELANALRDALADDALTVHYQPQIDLRTGRLVGLEALLRWHRGGAGWVPPTSLIPLAEDFGFMPDLDQWVLERACADIAALRAKSLLPDGVRLALNRSARTLAEPDFVTSVTAAAESAGLPLDTLEIEVTETVLLTDVVAASAILDRLRGFGIGVALDDFGTGYSSLAYIRQMPVTTVKIDRSFVQHIVDRPHDLAITTSIVHLGNALGLRTIAEGVTSSEQLDLLRGLGCAAGQGHLWAAALPLDEVAGRLAATEGAVAGAPMTPQPARVRR